MEIYFSRLPTIKYVCKFYSAFLNQIEELKLLNLYPQIHAMGKTLLILILFTNEKSVIGFEFPYIAKDTISKSTTYICACDCKVHALFIPSKFSVLLVS